jgi:hypothetical protein
MNDTFFVRSLQRFGDLFRDCQGLLNRNRTTLDSSLQRLAFHQLHDNASRLAPLLEAGCVQCWDDSERREVELQAENAIDVPGPQQMRRVKA